MKPSAMPTAPAVAPQVGQQPGQRGDPDRRPAKGKVAGGRRRAGTCMAEQRFSIAEGRMEESG